MTTAANAKLGDCARAPVIPLPMMATPFDAPAIVDQEPEKEIVSRSESFREASHAIERMLSSTALSV
jgi:hypothetical protein